MNILKKKSKIIVDIEYHKIIFGSYCPKCKTDGGLFHYDNDILKGYLCENCCKRFSDEEYEKLLIVAQRKKKLDLLNEFKY